LYRLRRAIGRERILYDPVYRLYSINKDLDCDYDVDQFLSAINQAEAEKDPNLQITYYRQAISLYTHPFAPQLDGIWAEPIRRNLYLRIEKALLIVASHELKEGHFQACINSCQILLEIEPCQENAYQLSMRGYSLLGNRTALVRIYQACQENFDLRIGIPPSQKTISLFQELSI